MNRLTVYKCMWIWKELTATDQKFIPRFKFALYFFAQIPLRQLEVLTQISIILQQGKVAIGDANQLCHRKGKKMHINSRKPQNRFKSRHFLFSANSLAQINTLYMWPWPMHINKWGLRLITVWTYLIVQSLDIRNIHVVGRGTDIFIFLSSKYVYSNHVHLKRKLSKYISNIVWLLCYWFSSVQCILKCGRCFKLSPQQWVY